MPKLKKTFKLTLSVIAKHFGISVQAVSKKAKSMGHDGSLRSWLRVLNFYFNKYDK